MTVVSQMILLHKIITLSDMSLRQFISYLMAYQSTFCDMNCHIPYLRTVPFYLFISFLSVLLDSMFHESYAAGIVGNVLCRPILLFTRCMFSFCYCNI
jgi:hypothetical protein